MIMYFTSYGVFFVTYFALACCEKVRKKSPGNLIAMAIFTISLSLMVRENEPVNLRLWG